MKFLKIALSFICIIQLLGCDAKSDNRSTFYITPVIEGVNLCEESINHEPSFETAKEAMDWCISQGYNAASLLNEALEKLEPGGASGEVQVGYELPIFLLSLYEKSGEEWRINEKKVDSYLDLIKNINRPVVVYLMANHFDTEGPLPKELSKNPDNLMLLKNGDTPNDEYYGNSVVPFTLLTDESIPVNHYRFNALRHIGNQIAELPTEVRSRIVGITMAGETHHLYPDFTNGAGATDNFLVTDYSTRSIDGFQRWLEDKYGDISKLNNEYSSVYGDFQEIYPPSKNIHKEKMNSFTEHFDQYAAGTMPISGWLWDPTSIVEELEIYIDGEKFGDVEHGLHRLDVYREVKEITSPNVGFRYDLDYRGLSPGQHDAQVVVKSRKESYLIAQVRFVVVDRNQELTPDVSLHFNSQNNFKNAELLNIKYWLDQPTPLTALYYNPLARDWNEYREHQVLDFLNYFWKVANESGLPRDKLFSHQISSRINSSWNYQLFMEAKSVGKELPYKLGINLYGGATNSDAIRRFLEERETTEYGVPEYHIQQWKLPNVALDSLEAQFNDGATFISPYYISIIPDSLKPQESDTLQRFNIRADNKLEGSNQLFQAIIEFAKH
ncbi:beta-galactosidase [Paenibacillus lautus]|uniref:beta-galactosidase n=1 Tax=Paenibacillus lautus TaxID=1401 RepID=UPI000FD89BEC|nr:beta-galactosidase [Paenibacillus lautus]